ncbi:putative progesterone binding protein [Delitschia confertaspora ATCC 74209]|uniref:Progesterone binding protein n=1 Tax=Delitschia confertaspora ATCC 74209 TaxID=1513339 RepID=A0A9P4MWK2_9PLEO|nr:putative progesterone binding protein [Delitschia confertaspora ATCC 74209]
MSDNTEQSKKFQPKTPVELAPPKDDPITFEYLSKCDGTNEGYPTYVAIMGTVFDVTGNASYTPGKGYHVFAGKEPNRALAKSSLKPEDCIPDYEDLPDNEKKVLNDWYTFFSKRYNVVGKVKSEGSSNL